MGHDSDYMFLDRNITLRTPFTTKYIAKISIEPHTKQDISKPRTSNPPIMHLSAIIFSATAFLSARVASRPYTNTPSNDISSFSTFPTFISPHDINPIVTARKIHPSKDKPVLANSGPSYTPGLGRRGRGAKAHAEAKQKAQEEQEINDPAGDVGLGKRALLLKPYRQRQIAE